MILHQEFADTLNYWLSLGTLIGLTFLTVWVLALLIPKKHPLVQKIVHTFARYALPIGFFAALFGSILTLVYSDYIGYVPCALCWFQRIFLYPMILLFGVAWWRGDRNIYPYTAALSVAGLIVAGYHHYLQLGYNPLIPCPADAMFADCAVPPFIEFGFVSFPFMALVLFGFLLLLSISMRVYKREVRV